VRHKFTPFAEILNKHIVDVLMIQETKLNDTFPVAQFAVDGFKMYRNDYTEHAGGLMMYVRDDLGREGEMIWKVMIVIRVE
jgi:exonuclease III